LDVACGFLRFLEPFRAASGPPIPADTIPYFHVSLEVNILFAEIEARSDIQIAMLVG